MFLSVFCAEHKNHRTQALIPEPKAGFFAWLAPRVSVWCRKFAAHRGDDMQQGGENFELSTPSNLLGHPSSLVDASNINAGT